MVSASSASAAPRPSAPVSPMKIRAGAAFHQRNPTQAPASATARIARSKRVDDELVDLGWRKPQKPMTVKAKKPRMAEPAARPSSPSVRFTALTVAKMIRPAHSTQPTLPSSQPGRSARVNRAGVDLGERHHQRWRSGTTSRA